MFSITYNKELSVSNLSEGIKNVKMYVFRRLKKKNLQKSEFGVSINHRCLLF